MNTIVLSFCLFAMKSKQHNRMRDKIFKNLQHRNQIATTHPQISSLSYSNTLANKKIQKFPEQHLSLTICACKKGAENTLKP